MMLPLAYSSTVAFLAHYRMLTQALAGVGGAPALSAEDHEILAAMEPLMKALPLEERAILLKDPGDGDSAPGEARRRHERAYLRLRRLLLTKGVVRG